MRVLVAFLCLTLTACVSTSRVVEAEAYTEHYLKSDGALEEEAEEVIQVLRTLRSKDPKNSDKYNDLIVSVLIHHQQNKERYGWLDVPREKPKKASKKPVHRSEIWGE